MSDWIVGIPDTIYNFKYNFLKVVPTKSVMQIIFNLDSSVNTAKFVLLQCLDDLDGVQLIIQ